ncbi:hypothetical protein FRB91_008731 [Serendipita sp. 411]|nr:hypothetical protein FRB91_008731 [Serendipita sp. 411]
MKSAKLKDPLYQATYINPDFTPRRKQPEARPLPNAYAAYNEKTAHFNIEISRESKESIDTMLVFAGLFSAVISTLVSQTSNMLGPDRMQYTNTILLSVVDLLNRTNADAPIPRPTDESIENFGAALGVNILLFSSLFLSLLAALAAMLVKQWVQQFELGLGDSRQTHWKRARRRAQKYRAFRKSGLRGIVRWIPMLLHLALFSSFAGLSWWMYTLHRTLCIVSVSIAGIGLLLYMACALIPSFRPDSPFVWPVSTMFGWITFHTQRIVRTCYNSLSATMSSMPKRDAKPELIVVPSYVLTPETITPEHGDQHLPPKGELLDLFVLDELLRETDSYEDADAALDTLRLCYISGNIDHEALLKSAPLFLRHCAVLAETCWKTDHFEEETRAGYWARSRRLCRFIEWLYYQLSTEERRTVGPWPKADFAWAVFEESMEIQSRNLEDDEIFEDIVLSSSVIAKLRHVTLKEGEQCSNCWGRIKPSRQTLCDQLRLHSFIQDPDPDLDRSLLKKRNLISAIIISDYDCLINYCHFTSTQEYEDVVDYHSVNRCSLIESAVDPDTCNYESLRLIQAKLRGQLENDDPRLSFFKRVDAWIKQGRSRDPNEFIDKLDQVESQSRQQSRQITPPLRSVRIIKSSQ